MRPILLQTFIFLLAKYKSPQRDRNFSVAAIQPLQHFSAMTCNRCFVLSGGNKLAAFTCVQHQPAPTTRQPSASLAAAVTVIITNQCFLV